MKEARIKFTGPSAFDSNRPPNPKTEIQVVVGEKTLDLEFPEVLEHALGWLFDLFGILGLGGRYDTKEGLLIVDLDLEVVNLNFLDSLPKADPGTYYIEDKGVLVAVLSFLNQDLQDMEGQNRYGRAIIHALKGDFGLAKQVIEEELRRVSMMVPSGTKSDLGRDCYKGKLRKLLEMIEKE